MKQVNTANEKLPPVVESLNEIPKVQATHKEMSKGIQISIDKLNQQIELARDIANRIKVGVKFYPNTTLELRNPKSIEDLTTSTKFSGYFKTDKLNGLLLYLGNPVGTGLPKTKTVSNIFYKKNKAFFMGIMGPLYHNNNNNNNGLLVLIHINVYTCQKIFFLILTNKNDKSKLS